MPSESAIAMATNINQSGSNYSGNFVVHPGGQLIQGNSTTIQQMASQCLADLRVTDPRHDKTRIEETNGGLLKDSYDWVLDDPDFRRWRDVGDHKLLWVKGDPGKGKTMLLCGIINQLHMNNTDRKCLAYFFFQANDVRINNATAMLRSLIYMLLTEKTALIRHVQKRYDDAGKALFEDTNAWQALSQIFIEILQDDNCKGAYFIVDALDECMPDSILLLKLIEDATSGKGDAKWLISSRNKPEIEERLRSVDIKLSEISLEKNAQPVSAAVEYFITSKVSELANLKKYKPETQDEVRRYLSANANGTFLWVALVCQALETTTKRHAIQKLKSFPPGLKELYTRMMQMICQSDDKEDCEQILALIAIAYRPISLVELPTLMENSEDFKDDIEALKEVVRFCGSFLTVREDRIYFVHQTARDFLIETQSRMLFPDGEEELHSQILFKSIESMSQLLTRDIYQLYDPGIYIGKVARPAPDPLGTIAYSCVYWVSHFTKADMVPAITNGVQKDGDIHLFLRDKFLHWVEALSLLGCVSDGILALERLRICLSKNSEVCGLQNLVLDAYHFLQSFRLPIENWPLQAYASGLIFSPAQSLIRGLFRDEQPQFVQCRTSIAEQRSACITTLEGHRDSVNSAAFSTDGRRIITASGDSTVKIWDAATGVCVTTLDGHRASVESAAFSRDGQCIVSWSEDCTAMIWDATTGARVTTLKAPCHFIRSVDLSADGRHAVTTSYGKNHMDTYKGMVVAVGDGNAKIWDAATGSCTATLERDGVTMNSAVFSFDGRHIVTAASDGILGIWNMATGVYERTWKGHGDSFDLAAFSKNGQRVLSASSSAVQVWNSNSGACLATLQGHEGLVYSTMFSADEQRILSASRDTVKVWDPTTSVCVATLEGYRNSRSAVFSADGQCIVTATASLERAAKVWDTATGKCLSVLESHGGPVNSAVFSANGQLVLTASQDRTAKIWDAFADRCPANERCLIRSVTPKEDRDLLGWGKYAFQLEDRGQDVNSAAFSVDGQRAVTTALCKNTARIWDVATGSCAVTLDGHESVVTSAAFSTDGQRIITASLDKTVKIWEAVTGNCALTLKGHQDHVTSASFSVNGQRVASSSKDRTARIWNAITGVCVLTLEGHTASVESAVLSADGQRIVTASCDTAKVWDAANGTCIATLEGHGASIQAAVFSADKQRIVTASHDKTAIIWNATTGACAVKLNGHTGKIYSAAFSTDDQYIVTASGDRTAKIWDATTGACIWTLKGHYRIVISAAFSVDGRRVVTVSGDRTARIWDAVSGICITTLKGPGDWIRSAAFSADGRHIITASYNGNARFWDNGLHFPTHEGHNDSINSVTFSANGRRVATTEIDGTAKVWNVATGVCVATFETFGGFQPLSAFSADGQRLVTTENFNQIVRIWDAATGASAVTLYYDGKHSVRSVSFSADGQRVITALTDETVKIWNATTGACMTTLNDQLNAQSATFSADGQRVVSMDNCSARIWNSHTGACLATLEGPKNASMKSATFSAAGQRVVTTVCDSNFQIWDAVTGAFVAKIEGYGDRRMVLSAALSADGRFAVALSDNGVARICDVATGECVATYEVGDSVKSVSFDRADTLIHTNIGDFCPDLTRSQSVADATAVKPAPWQTYSISSDGAWILKRCEPILWIPSEYRPSYSAVFTADGVTDIVLGCSTGQVCILNFPSSEV